MKKQMGLVVSANYYPCQTEPFFLFFKFIFGDIENLANCSQNLAEVVEFYTEK
jgi:hypothetical protein